jgi:hypothetical protein
MDLQTLLTTIDNLSPEDRERLKAHLAQQENARREHASQVLADLDAAIDEFWGESSDEEMQSIFEAMRTKSTPSEKGL